MWEMENIRQNICCMINRNIRFFHSNERKLNNLFTLCNIINDAKNSATYKVAAHIMNFRLAKLKIEKYFYIRYKR
jgi:hypothetical protein